MLTRFLVWIVVAAGSIAFGAPAEAQRPQRPLRGAPVEEGATPAEIQRMFDAYALLQAQEQLKINDAQYTQFLSRFKTLQDVRRRAVQQRARVIMDLQRLLNEAQPDDTQIKDRMQMLADIEARSQAEARKAHEAIDQVLDLRQQAKFRVFEDLMERRKLELVTRARLANRPRQQP